MDTRTVMRTRFFRNHEEYRGEVGKNPDPEENVQAGEGRPSPSVQHASAWGCGHDYNKKIIKPACWSEKSYTREAQSGNDKKYADGEVKDLLLLGVFCFCLLALNVACWSFFAGVPAGR